MDMAPPAIPPFSRTPAPHSSPASCDADLLNIHRSFELDSVFSAGAAAALRTGIIFTFQRQPLSPSNLTWKSAAPQPDGSKVHDQTDALSLVGAQNPDLAAGCFCWTSRCTD